MTLIGMLIVIALVGMLGLAVIKIVPLYLERMRITAVLNDSRAELSTGPVSATSLRSSLNSRFYVENVDLERDELQITREGDGYEVRVQKELRTPYLGGLWFLILVDEKIEIAQ
jgi:hypothetical protein